MTTGYWLHPEESPCEFHNNQWAHRPSLNSIIPSKCSVSRPWAVAGKLQGRRITISKSLSKLAPFLIEQKRKIHSSDHGTFGFGCGVRSAGVVPPRNNQSFGQPAPSEMEKQYGGKRDLRWQREHLILTSKHLPSRAPLPDKGKPAVRRGRKATDQISDLRAGLPEEE
jgi:hypothetical protein